MVKDKKILSRKYYNKIVKSRGLGYLRKKRNLIEASVSPEEPVDTTKYVMLASGGNLLLADGSKLKLVVQ